ncbi:MAG: hypothetical protein P0107_05085 [Nitrosomonas sp.]|nr:hypothetical protein [Nitrosomonas sp.]
MTCHLIINEAHFKASVYEMDKYGLGLSLGSGFSTCWRVGLIMAISSKIPPDGNEAAKPEWFIKSYSLLSKSASCPSKQIVSLQSWS